MRTIFQLIINYLVILYRKVMCCPIVNSLNSIKKFFPYTVNSRYNDTKFCGQCIASVSVAITRADVNHKNKNNRE